MRASFLHAAMSLSPESFAQNTDCAHRRELFCGGNRSWISQQNRPKSDTHKILLLLREAANHVRQRSNNCLQEVSIEFGSIQRASDNAQKICRSSARDHAFANRVVANKLRSTSLASLRMVSSSPNLPTICIPIGRPFSMIPTGILMAGWPVKLKTSVKGENA